MSYFTKTARFSAVFIAAGLLVCLFAGHVPDWAMGFLESLGWDADVACKIYMMVGVVSAVLAAVFRRMGK